MPEDLANLLPLAAGGALLLFGRRLFWLLLAAAGFVAGALLADAWLGVDSETARWIVALLAGLLGAMAAVFLQRAAIAVGGAFIGGYAAWWYLTLTWDPLSTLQWVLVIAAAVVGALAARAVFEIALVALSSLAGAMLILDTLAPAAETSRWLYLVLVVLGAAVQISTMNRSDES